MNAREIKDLFDRIKSHYTMFTYDDKKIQEWYRFLKDYDNDEVNKELDKYIGYGYDNPPLVHHLNRNLTKKETNEENSWITECEYCKQRFTIYNNDMREYEKHHRKCSKIDFIDRMCVRFRGHHVATAKYYEMSDSELDSAYHQIMNFYLQNKDKDEKEFLKDFPDE